MTRQLSIKLSDEEYEKLMSVEGKTKTDKIKNLLINKENNYFTQHFHVDGIKNYSIEEQALIALGVLMRRVCARDYPEKWIKVYIPKMNKGDIVPLFRAVIDYAYKNNMAECYDDLIAFVSSGLLLLSKNPVDDPGYYRVLGETLARNFARDVE